VIQEYKGAFVIASSTYPTYTLNLDGSVNQFGNATPVLIYPFGVFAGPDNQVWYFNSTTATKGSPGGSAPSCTTAVSAHAVQCHSPEVGAIIGGVVGGVGILLVLVFLAFCVGKRRGASATQDVGTGARQPLPNQQPSNNFGLHSPRPRYHQSSRLPRSPAPDYTTEDEFN